MITYERQPVSLIAVDEDNMCSIRLPDGRVRVVSAYRLKGSTGGAAEVAMAVRRAKDETMKLEKTRGN